MISRYREKLRTAGKRRIIQPLHVFSPSIAYDYSSASRQIRGSRFKRPEDVLFPIIGNRRTEIIRNATMLINITGWPVSGEKFPSRYFNDLPWTRDLIKRARGVLLKFLRRRGWKQHQPRILVELNSGRLIPDNCYHVYRLWSETSNYRVFSCLFHPLKTVTLSSSVVHCQTSPGHTFFLPLIYFATNDESYTNLLIQLLEN